MLEAMIHGLVSVSVIVAATVLAAMQIIDSVAWAGAVGAGIAASGAVTVMQGKVANGHINEELHTLTEGAKDMKP